MVAHRVACGRAVDEIISYSVLVVLIYAVEQHIVRYTRYRYRRHRGNGSKRITVISGRFGLFVSSGNADARPGELIGQIVEIQLNDIEINLDRSRKIAGYVYLEIRRFLTYLGVVVIYRLPVCGFTYGIRAYSARFRRQRIVGIIYPQRIVRRACRVKHVRRTETVHYSCQNDFRSQSISRINGFVPFGYLR